MLFLSTPAGIEDYVRALGEPAKWPWLQPPPDGPRLAAARIAIKGVEFLDVRFVRPEHAGLPVSEIGEAAGAQRGDEERGEREAGEKATPEGDEIAARDRHGRASPSTRAKITARL